MRADIEPALGHGHDHIRMAETKRRQKVDPAVHVVHGLPHQVFARDPEMHSARTQLMHDLGGGGVLHRDIGQPIEFAAIAALVSPDA